MLTRWGKVYGFEPSFPLLHSLRDQMNRVFHQFEGPFSHEGLQTQAWPQANLFDRGDSLRFVIALPGLTEKDVQISANAESMTIQGERKIQAPEGFVAHRQERNSLKFSRSFAFPARINVETIQASMKDGLLTIELAKAEDAKPRQIQIKAEKK